MNFSQFAISQKFDWAKEINTFGYEGLTDFCVDKNENIFICGQFSDSIDIDPSSNTFYLDNTGNPMASFIAKYDSSGVLLWGGMMADTVNTNGAISIAVDSLGNSYVVGFYYFSIQFNVGGNIETLNTIPGNAGHYICKYSPSGVLLWVKGILTNSGGLNFVKIQIDNDSNCFLVGSLNGSADFDPGPSTSILFSTSQDMVICKLDTDGNYVWSLKIGGTSQNDEIRNVDFDDQNNVYCVGHFGATVDFDPGSGVSNLTAAQGDAFCLKLRPNGTFIWVKKISGPSMETIVDVRIAKNADIYSAGNFKGVVDFDPSTGVSTLSGGTTFDIFFHKMDSSGVFSWVRKIGGALDDNIGNIDIDSLNNVYVTGNFSGTVDFYPNLPVLNYTSIGNTSAKDIFITKYDQNGNYEWMKRIGGDGASDLTRGLVVTPGGNVYSAGRFIDTVDMNTGNGVLNFYSNHLDDSFFHKLVPCEMTYGFDTLTHCGNFTSPSGDHVWTTSGSYIDVLTNSVGCDSVVQFNLTIIPLPTRVINASACFNYTSPSGNHIWTANGTYMDTIPNVTGCDSMFIVNLTLLNSVDTLEVVMCDSLISPSGLYVWYSSGVYHDTIVNYFGCDSLLTIDVIKANPSFASINVSSCSSYSSPSGQYSFSSSGVYLDTLVNWLGCDSIVTINFTLLPSQIDTLDLSSCVPISTPSGNQLLNSTGVYYDTLVNQFGCDSVLMIQFTLNEGTSSIQDVIICDSLISPSGQYVWNTTGTYTDTLLNSSGCDSILTFNITKIQINTVVDVLTGPILHSANNNASNYLWLDCLNNYQSIPGEVNQDFTPNQNGSYAVEIHESGCVDTSDCMVIDDLYMNELPKKTDVSIYPNPTSGFVTVLSSNLNPIRSYTLTSPIGQLIVSKVNVNLSTFELELTGQPGVYFLEVILLDNSRKLFPIVLI